MLSGGPVQIQSDPIYTLPYLYTSGLNISFASSTVIAIAPGQARDSSDSIDMPVGYPNLQNVVNPALQFQNYMPPLFINAAVNGANGLDQGSLIATMDYAIYLIGDSRGYNNVAGLLSLTSNAYPLLPKGYDSYRLLGFAQTGATTTYFVASATNPLNVKNSRSYYLSPAVSVLSGGASTTFAAISLATPIPTTTARDVIAYLLVTFIPAAIGDVVQFRPTAEGTPQVNGLVTIVGVAAGIAQTQYVQVVCGVSGSVPEIDYIVTSASDSVSVSVVGYAYVPTAYIP